MRSLAMAKQAELSKLVTELQRGRMDSLVTWMGKAEATLATLAEPPGSREELAEQCGRKEILLEELEEQQATVSSISHFILVESEETKGLEEELALLGERWHKLCKGCEERHAHMETLASLWAEVTMEGELVARWIADVEVKLRKMELEEVEEEMLQEQGKEVRVSTLDEHRQRNLCFYYKMEKTRKDKGSMVTTSCHNSVCSQLSAASAKPLKMLATILWSMFSKPLAPSSSSSSSSCRSSSPCRPVEPKDLLINRITELILLASAVVQGHHLRG